MIEGDPGSAALRVLIVEDSEDDVRLLVRDLEKAGYEVESLRVDTRAGLRAALERREWDVVLGDYSMPGFSGTEALATLKELGHDVPFIFVSGTIREDTAVDAMRSGAKDYVMKGNLRRLIPAIEREVRDAVTRRERRRAEERLHHLLHHDALTGLPNRRLLSRRLRETLAEAERSDRVVGVAFLDLDRLKSINETLGHAAGDRLIEATGERLLRCVRSGDTVARLSGDEFALVLADLADPEEGTRIAREVLERFQAPFHIGEHELYAGVSLGMTFFPLDATGADGLLRNADGAVHRAKGRGRNNLELFTESMRTRAAETLALEHGLRRALEREELRLHYQPVVAAGSGRIVQLEALLRWNHPDLGPVSPSKFIPLAEETGLIVPLGEWVLRAACEQAARWRAARADVPPVALNVSAVQFRRVDLARRVQEALERAGLPGAALVVELTETALSEDPDETAAVLRRLRDLGVTVSLDDFGTGYSSLDYLKRLPLDRLKIDRSFVRHLPDDPNDTAIATAVIAMSRHLGIDVVAEGVESQFQVDFLRSRGCDLMQGYFFGRPAPARDVEALLRRRDGDAV